MRDPYTQIYAHLVWATWDRYPIICPEWKTAISACIQAECTALKIVVIAQHLMSDHAHLLVRLPTTVEVARPMKQVKGASSHLVIHQIASGEWFQWQGSYGAFSVSKADVPRLIHYIQTQEQHHQEKTFGQKWAELEQKWAELEQEAALPYS